MAAFAVVACWQNTQAGEIFQEDVLMTKADLVEKIAAKANLTKAAAERALNAFLNSVEDALVKESKLTLTGFGTFAVETRKARQGRNPRTGDTLTIPACKILKFRPGKMLKDSLNQVLSRYALA